MNDLVLNGGILTVGAGRTLTINGVLGLGGTITGEHGVGLEKQEEMALIFSEPDLRVMQQVREAWNPRQLLNPGKLFPQPGRCAEIKQL